MLRGQSWSARHAAASRRSCQSIRWRIAESAVAVPISTGTPSARSRVASSRLTALWMLPKTSAGFSVVARSALDRGRRCAGIGAAVHQVGRKRDHGNTRIVGRAHPGTPPAACARRRTNRPGSAVPFRDREYSASRALVAGVTSARGASRSVARSTISSRSPPESVTIPIPPAPGRRGERSSSTVSNSSSGVVTRITL